MSVFVTGTDTGVGKTAVAVSLALKLGYRYWKPVQSGLEPHTDSQWAARFLDSKRIDPEVYRLTQPLSPHASARIDGIRIDLGRIVANAPARDTVVEGAGGFLVPLNEKVLIADLIQALGLSAVVIARSGLGTLNHTLLTLEAMKRRALKVAGVVMVGEKNQSNKEALEYYGGIPVIGEIPIFTELTLSALHEIGERINLEVASGRSKADAGGNDSSRSAAREVLEQPVVS